MNAGSDGPVTGRRSLSLQALGLSVTFPVTVLTGFLGSGKTTLLKQFLTHPQTHNTAVIVNELGEVGLDHLLIHSPTDETVLLDNGCVCCTLRGDLSATLQELVAARVEGRIPPFERVVIETTGTADPVPLLQTILEDSDVQPFFRLDGLITVVDALNGESQLDQHFQSVKQAAVADRIVISKPDLVDEPGLERLARRLQHLNPGVPVDVAAHGRMPPARLTGASLDPRYARGGDVEAWLSESACAALEKARAASAACDHEHGPDEASHHHADAVQTFSVRRDSVIHPAGLKLWLDLLSIFQGPRLLRVKGILNVAGRPVVVNLVQHASHPPESLDSWPGDDRDTRIVFITHGLQRADLESTLEALDFEPQVRAGTKHIDAADYQRFTGILARFRGAAGS